MSVQSTELKTRLKSLRARVKEAKKELKKIDKLRYQLRVEVIELEKGLK